MTIPIDLVLNPVDGSWAQILDVAGAAHQKGYAGLWVLDHVSGAPFGAASTSECFTLLGALAAALPELPVGPLVVNAAARPVAVSALALETLGRIAGDRLRIAIGAGAGSTGPFAVEHDVLGSAPGSMAERHQRVAELITEVRSRPGLQGRPVVVGANSAALAALAGRTADGLNVGVDHPDRGRFIDAARAEAAWDFEVSAWARWRDDLIDPTSSVRRGLAADGVRRLMLAVRPIEVSAHALRPVG